ncbi:MAG TPA: N-formylglutamate amidohydrolase, partial [Arenimonas sp.]
MSDVFSLHRGELPLLVSLPHDGIALPEDIAARVTDAARGVPDTDWYVGRLYDFARALGASVLVPNYSRYVVDLNRPQDDVSLYPGQNTTGLCPARRFTGDPIYLPGKEPTPEEVAARVERYWRPYHDALQEELQRL